MKSWGYDEWRNGDKFGRDAYGCPPKSYGDLAFVQHMVASLRQNGILGVVLPHGILFRGGTERKIRQGLLENDLIEAIIGLTPNLFYGTNIPACILLINKAKPPERKGKVLFVNGIEERVEGKNQNLLSEENVKRLSGAFNTYKDEYRFSRIVGIEDILKNDYDLNIAQYVKTFDEEEHIDVAAVNKELKELIRQRDESYNKIQAYLKELGYDE